MNMIFLYWFGRLIQEYLGNQKLLNLYILSAISGGLAFMLIYNVVPGLNENSVLLGASGAVLGIVIGAATLIPEYTFYLLFMAS